MECDRRGDRLWSATAGHTSKGLSSTCHRPSSSTLSYPRRARLQGLARLAAPGRDARIHHRPAARAQPRGRPGERRGGHHRLRAPQGLQANNIGRIAVLLSEKLGQETNGITLSRYCASGLDAIRSAANNVVAGQGDVYIASGVEFVSRYNAAQEAAHPEDQNEQLQGKEPGQPDAYIAMGLTAENVADKWGVTR